MDTIFMTFKNSDISDPHGLLLNDKYVALTNLHVYYTWKNIKKSYKNIKIFKIFKKFKI